MPKYKSRAGKPSKNRLPNGFGQIIYLGSGRSRPYAVYPPTKMDRDGKYRRQPAICYVTNWFVGLAVLTAYKAGNYNPGMEIALEKEVVDQDLEAMPGLAGKIIRDFAVYKDAQIRVAKGDKPKHTFADAYAGFCKMHFEAIGAKYSESTKRSYALGYSKCADIYDKYVEDLTTEDLQNVIDSQAGDQSESARLVIKKAMSGAFTYAIKQKYVEVNMASGLNTKSTKEVRSGVPLTEADLGRLWDRRNEPIPEMILIMCYSGFRITAYETLTVNLEDLYFQGGLKTSAGKNRIVPIHSGIESLVRARLKRDGKLCSNAGTLRAAIGAWQDANPGVLEQRHHPHDFRHTFATLGKRYGVRDSDLMLMLGHSQKTITDTTYVHRTLDDLRPEIEKIPVANLLRDNIK